MAVLRLGGGVRGGLRRETLRGGELTFESPRGLAAATLFLIEALPRRPAARVLTGMDTEGAVALAARALGASSAVTWFHLDAYVAAKVRRVLHANGVADIAARVAAEVPAGPFDLVVLPFPASSESQLMWDLLEAGHDALVAGGRLIVATDGKPDALRAAVKKVFRNVTPGAFGRRGGASFYATRRREGAVLADRAHMGRAVIRPADGAAPLSLDLETRPGTFAYRRLDAGTRALAEAWAPAAGGRAAGAVLDVGAGCGALGIVAALRLPTARVTLVDSNARAMDCAGRNAERMGVGARVTTYVRADFEDLPEAAFDVVLANPPYFGDFRIARSFAGAARRALRPGGRAHFVARTGKAAAALAEILGAALGPATSAERGAYTIVTATR